MAQIQSAETYADGQQVTAARLNNQTNGATLLPGAVTDQTAISGGVASGDSLIVHDLSASALRKATVSEILGAGVPVVAPSVTGVAGADLVITPAAGQKADVAGPLEADSVNSIGNATVGGNLSVTGTSTLTGNVTATNAFTSNGVANFTGAFQLNGSPAFGLYEVYEETISSFVVSSTVSRPMNAWHNGFTSATFTKPSDEIWMFEAVLTVAPAAVAGVVTIDHFIYSSNNANTVIYSNKQGKNIGSVAQTNSASHTSELRWVIKSGTALTSETVKLWYYVNGSADYVHTFGSTAIDAVTGKLYPASILRIYKYKTA